MHEKKGYEVTFQLVSSVFFFKQLFPYVLHVYICKSAILSRVIFILLMKSKLAFSNCWYDNVQSSYGCFSQSKQTTVNKKLKISFQEGSPARLLMLAEMNNGTILTL